MSDQASFRGKCAIVTGAGRGIGREIARALARAGAQVHLVSRTSTASSAAQEIAGEGGLATAHVGSVADEAFVQAVVDNALTRSSTIDVLVNAAAILGPTGPFSATPMEQFDEVLGVNLGGAASFMRWTIPAMERAGFGRVINFAGGGAAYPYPFFSAYAASKAALVRLTENVAAELAATGVTVNIIAPGAVETDMLREVRRRGGEVRTLVSISEPVGLVMFLAGTESSHINGRFIHVRDNWRDPNLFSSADMLTLRRVERR